MFFQEFNNEDTWNIVKIFADEAVKHWPLLLVAIAMIGALWFGFSTPQYKAGPEAKQLARYYVVIFALRRRNSYS